jgi:hypothetical protein
MNAWRMIARIMPLVLILLSVSDVTASLDMQENGVRYNWTLVIPLCYYVKMELLAILSHHCKQNANACLAIRDSPVN